MDGKTTEGTEKGRGAARRCGNCGAMESLEVLWPSGFCGVLGRFGFVRAEGGEGCLAWREDFRGMVGGDR